MRSALNPPRRQRPPLATVICVYESLAILLGLISILTVHAFRAHHPNLPPPSIPSWQAPLTYTSLALALAGAIALWQMLPAATLFLGARFAIALGFFVYRLIHAIPRPTTHSTAIVNPLSIYLFFQALNVLWLLLAGAIAGYTYRITTRPHTSSPDTFYPGDRPAWPPQP